MPLRIPSLISSLFPHSLQIMIPVIDQWIITTSGIIVAKWLVDPREAVVIARLFRPNERCVELDPVLQIHAATSVCREEDNVAD